MEFKSINPYNGEQVGLYYALTQEELAQKLKQNTRIPLDLGKRYHYRRCRLLIKAGQVLRIM
jgi:succinate-semialdehyde dehydrogenase/glutarate-semialdehyde dehydrogenase